MRHWRVTKDENAVIARTPYREAVFVNGGNSREGRSGTES
jgi:hypothetical protein